MGYLAVTTGNIVGIIARIFQMSGSLPWMGVGTLGFHRDIDIFHKEVLWFRKWIINIMQPYIPSNIVVVTSAY